MTKLLRKDTVGRLVSAVLLASAAFASPADAASPARDDAPRVDGAAPSASPQQAGPEAQRGAKVPIRKFPHTMGPTVLHDNGPFVSSYLADQGWTMLAGEVQDAPWGGTILDPPREYPHYVPGYYAVFFADPDGIKLELVHIPG